MIRAVLAATLLVLLPVAVSAQQTDEQTQDYEDQDRRYFERYQKLQEQQEEEDAEEQEADEAEPPDSQLAADFVAYAEELVKDQNYGSRSNDLYRVQTDDPGLDSKAALLLLDSFRSFFDEFWTGRVELVPYDQQSRVFLFDSFYKYNELLGFDARRMPSRPEGHYISIINVMVLNSRASSPERLADSLVHESAHQLVDQRIFGGSGRTSTWLGEGLGTYFGFTLRDKSGEFQAGRIGAKSIALLRDARAASTGEASQRVRQLRSALRKLPDDDSFLIDLMSPGGFYGDDVIMNYTAAWMLVHFLLHAEDGRHADGFARYIESEVAGKRGPEVLFEILGMTAGELQEAYTAHVKKVKT